MVLATLTVMRNCCIWMSMMVILAACQVHAEPAQEDARPQEIPGAGTLPGTLPGAGAGAGASREAQDWLEKVEAGAATLKTLEARIRYDIVNPLSGDEQRRFGTLRYDAGPPGRFSVHLDSLLVEAGGGKMRNQPQNRWYIFDGRWLLERNHDEKVAIRRQIVPPDQDPAAVDPLGLGEGPFPLPLRAKKADILARFDVTVAPPADTDPKAKAGTVHLVLIPKPGTKTDAQQIDLWYDRDTLLPVRASMLSDDETVVTLLESKPNASVEADAFDTSLPTDAGWTTDVKPWEGAEPQ